MDVLALSTFALFATGVVAGLTVKALGRFVWLVAAVPAALTAYFLAQAGKVSSGEALTTSREWVPALGVDFALRLDGLALLFAVMICGVGTLVAVYSARYLEGNPSLGRFYALLFLFMGSMLGLVLADNLITLFLFWELTSISSFGLIAFESQKDSARSAANQALFVTGGGGLALLAGLVLIGIEAGTLSISAILEGGSLVESDLYGPILMLVLVGAFTKSAQAPFHFWLPNAMEAPTPVSAYLHSATMVKAGVYLLARFSGVLGDSDAWFYALTGFGALTMLLGGVYALRQTDLKRLLAYSTLSILGTLVFLLGIGTEEAVIATAVLLLTHACYKGALFLCAGIIDHGTGTRDLRELGGLAGAMPLTAACVALAAVGMAGLPPLMGFIAKEGIYEALQDGPRLAVLTVGVAVVSSALAVAAAVLLVVKPFLGRLPETLHPHEGNVALLIGPVVLSGLLIAGVLLPVDSDLISPAASSILGHPEDVSLSLWHGFNLTLALSAATVALGGLLYLVRGRLAESEPEASIRRRLSPEVLFDASLIGLNRLATLQTRVLQSGYLRAYVGSTLGAMLLLVMGTVVFKASLGTPESVTDPAVADFAVIAITFMGAGLAVLTASRLTAIISLGLVGYGIALLYALWGAPDLAMTQVLVETLMVLLMVFAFYRLPRFVTYSAVGSRIRDAVLACAVGVSVTLLLLTSLQVEPDKSLSNTLAETSKPEAHGGNVVNVILVDFRALDTLGEITVLGVAAVGIVSLLKLASRRRASS